MLLRKAVERISNVGHLAVYVAVAGLILSLAFCFLLYPKMADPHHLVLDPDHHGDLGYGIWKYHTFSYYPDRAPTVERGPLYPLFIAGLLIATGDWWPYSVQLGQCVLFVLTCLMVFWTSKILWGRQAAVVVSAVCVIHPLLLWYTSRIWVETMATFLFTAIVASTLYFHLRPNLARGILVGCAVGLSALCKGIFLPYAVLIPILFRCLPRDKIGLRASLPILLAALVLVMPWSVRNWRLTGKVIPMHGRVGFNLKVGDDLIDGLQNSPFSLADLWVGSMDKMAVVEATVPQNLERHNREILLDSVLLKGCLTRYRAHPGFLLKKVAINAWLFWSLGETPKKTLVLSILLVPLFVLFVISAAVIGRRGDLRSVQGIHIALAGLYYAMHLPVEAIARYSVVLVPTMLIYALGPILRPLLEDRE